MARTVLFSDVTVASMLNRNFECAWESVRTVPTITLDLGNGKVIRRTLHGNIATYVCNSDGAVIDILPGLYTPAAYTAALLTISRRCIAFPARHTQLERELAAYHGDERARLVSQKAGAVHEAASAQAEALPSSVKGAGLAPLLGHDTQVNETSRRLLIHEHLATAGLVSPQALTHWVYREVLHADLDDPYLGLRPLLSSRYPFSGEDGR